MLLLALAACSSGPGEPDEHPLTGKFGGVAEGDPFLQFAEDGSLSGNDGCNTFTGQWTRDGNEVDIELGAMTLMACEGVDTWLNTAAGGTVDATMLALRDAQDQPIGTLERN